MDAPSFVAGLALGALGAGLAAVAALRRLRTERSGLLARIATLDGSLDDARHALSSDNADLRRRLDQVADALLARPD